MKEDLKMTVFEGYKTTSPFGWRNSPFGKGREFHTGIDLVRKHKAPIHAFTEGTVLYAGMGKQGTGLGGYGNVVVVKDKNNRAQVYAHLDSVAVKKGAIIERDQIIGYQGSTGQSTGSHLHFEVRKTCSPSYGWIADRANNCLDPTAYLESFYPKKAAVSSKSNVGKTLYLHADQEQWAIYNPKVQPVKKNTNKVPLRPKKFGGLSYEILDNPHPDVYTIKTGQFGKMNIVVKPHYTGFTIK